MSLVEATERTIPALPCVTLEESLPFYESLGYKVTYQQKATHPYAVVVKGGIELHLFGLKGLKPENGYSTVLILVSDVESLHASLVEQLRAMYKKIPVAGFPRITRMRPGQTRFTLTDPAGNSLIFINRTVHSAEGEQKPQSESQSRLAKATETAATLRDSKGDDAAAAKVLDAALAREEPTAPIDRVRALAARVELAVALGDSTGARRFREELQAIPLADDEQDLIRDELAAADRLEQAIQ